MKIILAQHARTLHTARRQHSGQLDPPLSKRGRRQAKNLSRELRGIGITHAFCSDRKRSKQTARIVVAGTGVLPVPNRLLRQVDMGRAAGLTRRQAVVRFGERCSTRHPHFDFRGVGGESRQQAVRRYRAFFRGLERRLDRDAVVLVICHGTALRVFLEETGLECPERGSYTITTLETIFGAYAEASA